MRTSPISAFSSRTNWAGKDLPASSRNTPAFRRGAYGVRRAARSRMREHLPRLRLQTINPGITSAVPVGRRKRPSAAIFLSWTTDRISIRCGHSSARATRSPVPRIVLIGVRNAFAASPPTAASRIACAASPTFERVGSVLSDRRYPKCSEEDFGLGLDALEALLGSGPERLRLVRSATEVPRLDSAAVERFVRTSYRLLSRLRRRPQCIEPMEEALEMLSGASRSDKTEVT